MVYKVYYCCVLSDFDVVLSMMLLCFNIPLDVHRRNGNRFRKTKIELEKDIIYSILY